MAVWTIRALFGIFSRARSADSNNLLSDLREEARVILAYMIAHPARITWAMPLGAGLKIGPLHAALSQLVDKGLITQYQEPEPPAGRPARNHYEVTDPAWCRLQFELLYSQLLERFLSQGRIEAAHQPRDAT